MRGARRRRRSVALQSGACRITPLAYVFECAFFDTPVFTRQITALLDDGDYRQLQVTLALKPEAGDLIRASGGLRKIRWAVRGRGKSGGIRVINYLVDEGEIYFLLAYAKNEQKDLDSRQLRILRNLVKEEFK